jgi:hypothetical protein
VPHVVESPGQARAKLGSQVADLFARPVIADDGFEVRVRLAGQPVQGTPEVLGLVERGDEERGGGVVLHGGPVINVFAAASRKLNCAGPRAEACCAMAELKKSALHGADCREKPAENGANT